MADAMAENSGGVDWATFLKPFLSANSDISNKTDLLDLCATILNSKSEILSHRDTNRNFYNSFTLLASNFISYRSSDLSVKNLETVCAASEVLLKYFLNVLQTIRGDDDYSALQTQQYVHAIQVLCVGKGFLTSAEFSALIETMKSENISQNPFSIGYDNEMNKQDSSKNRSNLFYKIVEQLTLPLRDGQMTTLEESATDSERVPELSTDGDPIDEVNKLFLKENAEALQTLQAGEILFDLCLNLPLFKKARCKVEEALSGKYFNIPTTHAEALTLRTLLPSTLLEINLVSSVINLPILELLTPTKVDDLFNLAMASLYCAIGQASASAILSSNTAISPKNSNQQAQASIKEDDSDLSAIALVEEAMNIYNYIGKCIKESTKAGGHVYQNYLLAGAWVLISGLQTHFASSMLSEKYSHLRERDEKGRSPCKNRDSTSSRSGLQKFQQSFGVLSVALATKALNLLSELFEDLHIETCGTSSNATQVDPAKISAMENFTALQRIARILNVTNLNHLFFYLAIVSCRKASTLRRLHPPEGDTFSQSDSTTYYEDMIMCSDEGSTDEDDDSEPILGQWFEETLAPPEPTDTKSSSTSENVESKSNQAERSRSIIPEKGEAHGYISLATNIFYFLNKHFLCSKSSYISRYIKNGLTEQQMIILAAIIRDLDKEISKTEVGCFGSALGQLYCKFSGTLTRFTHNLITNSNLSHLQACLLNHLGVSPWNTDAPHAWPLQVYPRTLSVLAQVLLLRPQNEKEASVISIWHRLVNTLIENVLNSTQTSSEVENEDLNVEHAQVLLYLFHFLNLTQKKSVLLLMAGGILRCSEISHGPLRDSQFLHLSRLLLLFDYIMKHLYDAPTTLLEQMQWNLFYSTHLNVIKNDDSSMTRMYTTWKSIEDNYRKIAVNDEFAMKPRFYVLTNLDINNQDAPKLDGLACHFIVGSPDKLQYPLLLDALIEILNISHVTSGANASKITFLGLCATQYCFTICWRLLLLLPPSDSYMERIVTGSTFLTAELRLLHTLIWGPRTTHKNFNRWLRDCLVKQGAQNSDKLLKSVSDTVNNTKYDMTNAKNCIIALAPDIKKGIISKEDLPPLWHIFLVDSLLAKVQDSFEDTDGITDSLVTSVDSTNAQDLLPHVLRLAQSILHCTRWSVLHSIADQSEGSEKLSLHDFEGIQDVLAICSTKSTLTSFLSQELISSLPTALGSLQLQCNTSLLPEISLASFRNDIIPSESYILQIIDSHISTLSMNHPFNINLSLKSLLRSLIKFICDYAPKAENTDIKNKAIEMLVSVTLDLRTEFLYETVTKTLNKMVGDVETDEHQKRVYLLVLYHTYRLIVNCTLLSESSYRVLIKEKVLHNCLKFYERILEKSAGRQALESFFTGDKDLVKILMSLSNQQMSQQYSTRVLQFFNKLFQAAEKSSTDPSLNYLCSSIGKLATVEDKQLKAWLEQVIIGASNVTIPTTTVILKDEANSSSEKWSITSIETKESAASNNEVQKLRVQENTKLLQVLTRFIVKKDSEVSEDVSLTILKALIPLGTYLLLPGLDGAGFTDMMVVMTMLASAGSGKGHSLLFPACSDWIKLCNKRIVIEEIVEKISSDPESLKSNTMLSASACIFDYVNDVISIITSNTHFCERPVSPPWESEYLLDVETEWQDFSNDDDDSGEDSDEDSLCNKLCTFTVTQKEFMNQHWYHCHTCRMLDGVGVCSICARVCHKGHDLSYAKFGNFFCDCGAKEDGSCQALTKRNPQPLNNTPHGTNSSQPTNIFSSENVPPSSLRRRTSSPSPAVKFTFKEKKPGSIAKHIEASKESIISYVGTSASTAVLLEFLKTLIPVIEETCRQNSPVGCHSRGIKALEQLYSSDKKYINTEQLMVPTLGSQEGAFENVRMSYAGEQGQTIRQLLSAHIVRRVAMCCMTSTHGRRQHLAVSHEKGKITVLQLSALLKQADSSTRKLTLTRLATAPIPFTVLSLSGNLCNEDFLAVCGLKDCHVLTFTSSGSVCDHLVLHPQLETGNFIIKAIWLPGSQTKLALVTADFVKIYDLSVSSTEAQYFFLVPSGKIRDCTFMYEDGIYHIMLMSSPGHIYTEVLNEESSTKYGSFYVTNTLEIYHSDIADVNGQVAGGGVSIYYSHTLGILFYSYAQGKSFVSPILPKNNRLPVVFPIQLPQSNVNTSKNNGSRNSIAQPLCQWMEIPNHPGLVCCALQSSNNPVILMLKPDSILIQEIKIVPSKSKIMDMVAIRHSSGNELRTTLILLCEDGSLKMYMANMDQTGFWMSQSIQPATSSNTIKTKKKKVVKSGKSSHSVTFPVDFFEHCVAMNDVEFGGNDLLQLYNQAQLKHRLNTTGLYVACSKPLGLTVEITNNDPTMVMTGVRVLVGSQDIQRCPSFVEVFGRIIPITATRSRWYDIPFSREESLQSDKKLTILFGPSQDSDTITVIDSIKVYGKTKDNFGWPEETDETVSATTPLKVQTTTVNNEVDQNSHNANQLTKLEKLVVAILETLDGIFSLQWNEDKLASVRPICLKVTTQLLTLPTPPLFQIHSKALLSSLYLNKQQYHNYKDQALLQHVVTSIASMTNAEIIDLDAESYYRLVLIIRGIAVARPQNLVKFTDGHSCLQDVTLDDPLEVKSAKIKKNTDDKPQQQHFILQLIEVLWLLHSLNPEIPSLTPVVVQGLKHTEQVIHALVEIVHAFNSSETYSNITIGVYLQLLLCKDPLIAFSAKQALSKVFKPKMRRRRVHIPNPPHCISPLLKSVECNEAKSVPPVSHSSQDEENVAQPRQPVQFDVDAIEAINLLGNHGSGQDNHNINSLEALLGGGVGFPPIIDIPPDADDETMVELAIALSLQEHEIGGDQGQVLRNLQVQLGNETIVHQVGQSAQAQEAANFSDTTASAAGSDDEGSTAATDGSTLRTSPAEQGGSAGSESGGSGVESITGEHNVSGRSSAYGDNTQEINHLASRSESSIANTTVVITETEHTQSEDTEVEIENNRLHVLRLQLLERLIEYLPKLKNIEGVRAIPFLQVILQLTTELDGQYERDRNCLNSLLTSIVNELHFDKVSDEDVYVRTKQREIQLILMRLLSVFMQRCKSSTTSSTSRTTINDNSTFVSKTTATTLHKADVILYCNKLLQSLLIYWRTVGYEDNSETTSGNLLKEHMSHPPPDMTPFFQKQFVKDNQDVFSTYPQLLTDILLRLPYQIHRYSEITESVNNVFDASWYNLLCDYMMTPQTPFVKRQVRKLLMFICGNKETYRQLRDLHGLRNHMKGIRECCFKGGYQSTVDLQHSLSLPYDSLVELMEHLKYCVEVAQSRTGNWQRFCVKEDDVIQFLIRVSVLLDEGVSPTILQLLQNALVVTSIKKNDNNKTSVGRKEREKSDDSTIESLFEESTCIVLVEQINHYISREVFAKFMKTFMLETNITAVRWQAHALVQAIYKNSKPKDQESVLELLWDLWPLLPLYGNKAAQFVDLLGYFSLKFTEKSEGANQIPVYVERAIGVLRAQNEMLAHHPNANLYAHMAQFVELEGYYLESEPCLVCNNPEVGFTTIKLSSIKVDSKFTTTTQIVKLLSSHTISKITLKISDLKRSKMVKTINIFYNNRSVQAVVELKNKPALWHKAKKINLQSGQTEVKIEFPLPIVACNLMVEYADFYENIQASSETLQCPRCSASVPANPGVCTNCGENVFQCHKCRAINYDEKDPFLCHACGFCKYAKFDFSVLAKPCCAVEPIENDDDRKKTVSNINSLLEKADRVYKQLIANRPTLESLVLRITEHRSDKKPEDNVPTSGSLSNSIQNDTRTQLKVNKTIQMLAQQYCTDCKTSFEELSKIIQKVLVSRKELVAYDRKHRNMELPKSSLSSCQTTNTSHCINNRCYGCSTAATEHCLTLLRALALNPMTRQVLCSKGLIQELVWNNLRKGSIHNQEEVRQLLCVLTKDNSEATEELCNLLIESITLSLNGHFNSSDLGTSVRHEIALLSTMVQKEDDCWELKLRCMMKLFLKACEDSKSPLIMESIILPCLKILQSLMKPYDALNKKNKEKANVDAENFSGLREATVDVNKFIEKSPEHTFSGWKNRLLKRRDNMLLRVSSKEQVRQFYLAEKYADRWRRRIKKYSVSAGFTLDNKSWLKAVMFNPSSRLARQVVCNIVDLMSEGFERKREIIKLLTHFLVELRTAGESSAEFLSLYQNLIQEIPWKKYLAVHGVLLVLAKLVTVEIEQLHRLEISTLTSDLAQGYALNQLTELLASFLEDVAIRRQYKGRLVGAVLNGYLSLKILVVQRTRLIDETQEKLLELLEEMTTGTEEETKAFMSVCVKTVEKYSLQDYLTPVFIFERLCSIIYPEENDIGEFFLTLEKDPQQEDFLQGRMLGNPYSSTEAGLGPLMRDVKNKICQDCELVALLEDDNGMELLVNNKIMSLDLTVKDVYKKVWLAEGGDHEAMRIVYRMRGLLGDATEEFVESFNNKSQNDVDNEEVYKMANVLAECGGLQVMVNRLGAIQRILRAKPLLQVLLKLFRLCVKVNYCQEVLIKPEVGAMEVFLKTLKLCLDSEPDSTHAVVTEQLLDIMETILSKATSKSLEVFEGFSHTFGSPEYVKSLLLCTSQSVVKNNNSVLVHITRILAALVYGNPEKMKTLIDHFEPVLDFNKYDYEHTPEDQQKLEMFCVLTNGIEKNSIGSTFKDFIISLDVVRNALDYITMHAPCVKPTLLRTDSDELKEFISKPALKYILRFLTGLAHSHEKTQLAIANAETIPIIHRLEQVSSDEHVGSLAENLLEALCTNPEVAKQIDAAREFTRSEKKRLAMAMREKQLGQLGMRTNDKGQVTAKSTILQQIEELGDESGLVCCICREGYKYQPTKVLGLYTFTKRCNVEEYEIKARKTMGYSTVSHFNIVHIDCHMSAVRLARARDEWESAALQNANTKCNGLLPLWGPQVPESAFASCLARHNTYLQESTNHREIGHNSTIHDLKLLLLRFAQEKPFHEDTGGGGPQSNMHMIPYLIHIALYVINTTRVYKREEANLINFLETSNSERWIESAYEAEGPLYWITMSVLLHSFDQWTLHRVAHLKRLLVLAHARHCQPTSPVKNTWDKTIKDYSVYKPYLIFFGVVDGIYKYFFKNVSGSEEQWPNNLADYIRHNDEFLMKSSEKLLACYTEELLPCSSFLEFCDVTGLLDVLTNAETFINDLMNSMS